jgi:four helix bundle protein
MTQGAGSGEQGAGERPVVYPLGAEHGLVAEGKIESYRDLRVWQGAMDLVEAVYAASGGFPTDERFGLTSQIRRSAVSVPSNIAEGWGRASRNEYVQFLRYAQGSLREAETQWLLAGRLGFLSTETVADLEDRSQVIGRQLIALMRALR